MKKILHQIFHYRLYLSIIIVFTALIYSLINHQLKRIPQPKPFSSVNQTISDVTLIQPAQVGEKILGLKGILHPSLDSAERSLYFYHNEQAKFKKINLNDKTETELSPSIPFVESAIWSANHKFILLEFENLSTPADLNPLYLEEIPEGDLVYGLYDLTNKQFTQLDNHIITAAFLGDQKIMYQFRDENINKLEIASLNGNNRKNIISLPNDVEILGLNNSVLVRDLINSQVSIYSTEGGGLITFTTPKRLSFSRVAWDRDGGKNAIYWYGENKKIYVKHLNNDLDKIVKVIDEEIGDFSLIWDNIKGDIYLASFDGLYRLEAKVTQ